MMEHIRIVQWYDQDTVCWEGEATDRIRPLGKAVEKTTAARISPSIAHWRRESMSKLTTKRSHDHAL